MNMKDKNKAVNGRDTMQPSWIEDAVKEYEIRVYGVEGGMDARAKKVLREMLEKDAKFCEREWLHEELQAKHGEVRQ